MCISSTWSTFPVLNTIQNANFVACTIFATILNPRARDFKLELIWNHGHKIDMQKTGLAEAFYVRDCHFMFGHLLQGIFSILFRINPVCNRRHHCFGVFFVRVFAIRYVIYYLFNVHCTCIFRSCMYMKGWGKKLSKRLMLQLLGP